MIFVTIGTQEPFDRLIRVMDELAVTVFKDTEIVAQSFNNADYKIKNMTALNFISPKEFDQYVNQADLIISHAGMGTIISALVKNKPIIVMPRLLKFNEHRNEHQLSTARKFDDLGYVKVAYNEDELRAIISDIWPNGVKPLYKLGNVASDQLLHSLSDFISA